MTVAKRLLAVVLFWALVGLGAAIIALLATLPDPSTFADTWPESTAYMRLRAEEAEAEGRRFRLKYSPVPLSQISPSVQRAIRVAEDAAFFQHQGFDWFEVRQAVGKAWEEGEAPRGASTITQQLARNLYLSPRRNLFRKIREALITERLEAQLSKRRIFELYLNVIEWGSGIYGAEAAARYYYHVPAADLTREEAARLAAVPLLCGLVLGGSAAAQASDLQVGACCDTSLWSCTEDVFEEECLGPDDEWSAGLACADLEPPCEVLECPDPRTYTLDADFDEGNLVNVNHDVPDQLQLSEVTETFPFIWVAASGRGTIIKINTETGAILGEYHSAPNGRELNPSRTTVDLDGAVWCGNRDEPQADGDMGSVVQVALSEMGNCEDRNLDTYPFTLR